jgi:hypothetical protein
MMMAVQGTIAQPLLKAGGKLLEVLPEQYQPHVKAAGRATLGGPSGRAARRIPGARFRNLLRLSARTKRLLQSSLRAEP